MEHKDITGDLWLAGTVLVAMAVVYSLGGLMTVIVAAAICDGYLRRIEARQTRMAAVKAENNQDKG